METSGENYLRRNRMKKFAMGFFAILAGVVLLAFNFEILPSDFRHIIFSWQMLLIVIGVISLSGNNNRTPGLILISIGIFFILPELVNFHVPFVKLFWPVLLIAIGFSLLFKRRWQGRDHFHHRFSVSKEVPLEEGFVDETNVFSGSKHKIHHQVFKGGRITNIFGGTEIDLTQATLAEGQSELEIECLFGGVTIIVPADWKVVLNISSILGGFSDKRTIIRENPDSKSILIIKGTAIFGGGEIKSF
jgi:predicted membrane protein